MKFEKGSKGEIRRKLVRGSVAAPLLLTLRPGSAAASSATACLARSTNNAWPGWQEEPNLDEAFRMEVRLYKVKYQGTDYECYQDNNDIYRDKNTGAEIGSDLTPDLTVETTDSDYALVYVDPQGQIVGQYPEPKGGTALSTSCWSSVIPRLA